MSIATKYDVAAVTTESVFGTGSIAYRIPVFQRSYAWGHHEIDALLDDLFSDVDLTSDEDSDRPYFLGSIVLANDEDGEPLIVLDGQQRLTTMSLILAVLAARLKDDGDGSYMDITRHLQTGKAGAKKQPIMRLQDADAALYRHIIDDPMHEPAAKVRKLRLYRAVARVRDDLERRVIDARSDGANPRKALWRLVHRALYEVAFVRIVAPSQSEAFELFETLNDRGLALSAADLIKNKILAGAKMADFEDVVAGWENVVQLTGDGSIVDFLRAYWIANHGFVRKAQLYRHFERYLTDRSSTQIVELVRDLQVQAAAYRHVATPDPDDATWPQHWPRHLAENFKRINDFRARSCRPLFLAVASDAAALGVSVRFAETVTVRHSVIGDGNANSLERGYDKACRMIREEYSIETSITESLGDIVPSDLAFRTAFREARMGRADHAWRRMLVEINRAISSGETGVLGPKQVHIEHILPLSPSDATLQQLGISRDEHEEWVGAVGNLTLLSAAKNIKGSNAGFDVKRPLFAESEIKLNADLATKERWGIAEIRDRSEDLIDRAVQVWPRPPSLS